MKSNTMTFRISRIEGLSDGVFAIVMTLLVLELALEGKSTIHNNSDLWKALSEMSISFLSYFISFMVLGIYWVGQHNQFLFIEHSDRYFIWINILFLSLVSLVPFSTAILSEFFHLQLALIFYCANLIIIGLTLWLNWTYAFKKKLVAQEIDKTASIQIQKIILLGPLVYVVALGLSFISNVVSIISIFLIQGFYILHQTYDQKVNQSSNN